MDYFELFYERLSTLRIQKGVSARDMSLSLGQSESYVNKIENKRTMPSMQGFFYICEYLDISPKEFFDYDVVVPHGRQELLDAVQSLTPTQLDHLMLIVQDIAEK
ncbi:MAG: helix-turn-helix domain-containing protein [Clostridiales Family XIII bacterium]|nr:helix-turn-helix domain-containing protein [Clostridiales Family XIII bacterium]